jgi:predicted Zn-dependent peptidase
MASLLAEYRGQNRLLAATCFSELATIEAVTAADIQRVAAGHLSTREPHRGQNRPRQRRLKVLGCWEILGTTYLRQF